MHPKDKDETIRRYSERLKTFGYSEEALGWSRKKNDVRFAALIQEWKSELNNATVLDFGCGFGDFYGYCLEQAKVGNIQYRGIDINPDLIAEGIKIYPQVDLRVHDILEVPLTDKFDFIFSSGVFNHKLESSDEYSFISACIKTLKQSCNKGLALNFLSDKVDYTHPHTFHSNPGKILDICFEHTRNVVLRNDYMPFEFTVYLRFDAKVDPEKVVFIK